MERNGGFTAFELAVTIAIATIIAALVMPPYLNWLRGHRLRGATTNLMADLELAKIRAIRENAFVVVQFRVDGYTLFLDNGQGAGTEGDWIQNGGELLVREREMPTGVAIDLATMTLPGQRARFNGRGIPPDIAAAEIITVGNSNGQSQVRLNRLGHMETL
jgi:type IV fimbrial biogenesis protein FimT